MSDQRPQLADDVVGAFDQFCALPDKLVTTPGQRIMYRAGNGENFATLLSSEACTDKRSAAPGRLYDQGTETETTDQPVALRKVFAAWWATEWIFRT